MQGTKMQRQMQRQRQRLRRIIGSCSVNVDLCKSTKSTIGRFVIQMLRVVEAVADVIAATDVVVVKLGELVEVVGNVDLEQT
jgi:hypothetical protein